MNIDKPVEFETDILSGIGDAIDEVIILAERVRMMVSEGASFMDLQQSVYGDVGGIDDKLREISGSSVFTFSGEGFVPIFDYSQERPKTAFSQANMVRGRYEGISLVHPDDLPFISSFDNEDDSDIDDISGDTLAPDEVPDQTALTLLRPPPFNPKLYLEFMNYHSTGIENFVGGISVRSYDIAYLYVMDILNLEVDHIEITAPDKLVEEENIVDFMLLEAEKMRKLKRDTSFRRSNTSKQASQIDTRVEEINSNLGLHRITIVVDAERFYVSTSDDHKRQVSVVTLNTGQMHVEPIRVDSIESYDISGGTRIHSDKQMYDNSAGLCLVGSVNDVLADRLGLGSNIVWIPLAGKDADDFIVIPEEEIL